MISVISPIYNEAESLQELCERVSAALDSIQEPFEFILIDNGSDDNSLEIIKAIRADNPRIKYLSLSRNFGHQGAILAGLAYAVGDAVVSLDGDLQQPPELIPKMVKYWKENYDVVYTVKTQQLKRFDYRLILTRLFYKFIRKISDLKLSYGQRTCVH